MENAHEENKKTIELDVPLRLVNSVGAAAIMGFSRQRFAQLLDSESERIPEPFAYINDQQPVWLEADIVKY